VNNDHCFVYHSFNFSQSSSSFHLIFVLYQSSFSQLNKELLVQIITLVFIWKTLFQVLKWRALNFRQLQRRERLIKLMTKLMTWARYAMLILNFFDWNCNLIIIDCFKEAESLTFLWSCNVIFCFETHYICWFW
jgi:hypothetical protein